MSGEWWEWWSGVARCSLVLTLLYVLLGHQPHAHLAVYSADVRVAAPSRLLYVIRIDLKRVVRGGKGSGEW